MTCRKGDRHLRRLLVSDEPVAAVPAQRQALQLRQRCKPQAPRGALVGVRAAVQRQLAQAGSREVACGAAMSSKMNCKMRSAQHRNERRLRCGHRLRQTP